VSRRLAVAVLTVFALAVGVGGTLVLSLGDGSSAADDQSATSYRGSEAPPGIGMPEFVLTAHDGRRLRSAALSGRVTVLTFLDSQCRESCPVIAWTVARAIDALSPAERRDVRAVAISTDPTEDTPPRVRAFLARNRALGRLLYVGGGQPESKLRRVWAEFKVLSSLESGQDSLHSAPVRIYDRSGSWVATLHAGADLTETNLVHDIRAALASSE
jgi:cytochrome oxidase Cu insertion factor (SCO1/SenC/PrrC family)